MNETKYNMKILINNIYKYNNNYTCIRNDIKNNWLDNNSQINNNINSYIIIYKSIC